MKQRLFFVSLDMNGTMVVRGVKAASSDEAAALAVRIARVSCRITGREFEIIGVTADFPPSQVYTESDVAVEEAVARRLPKR
jgi:hypothetical protein